MQNGRKLTLPHVNTWVFDLDNTLYPAACNLMRQVDRRIADFIAELLKVGPQQARLLQKQWFAKYGTTLRGLMLDHEVDADAYLDYVHDIDHAALAVRPELELALAALEGRKIVYTNGSARHAEKVMERLGVAHHFAEVFDIAAADFVPKPDRESYARFVRRHALAPSAAAFFEDTARNLRPAAELGMTTVWVRSDSEHARHDSEGDHVHHVADDLTDWLRQVIAARRAA